LNKDIEPLIENEKAVYSFIVSRSELFKENTMNEEYLKEPKIDLENNSQFVNNFNDELKSKENFQNYLLPISSQNNINSQANNSISHSDLKLISNNKFKFLIKNFIYFIMNFFINKKIF
jgi:small-conductance mechanosensitive channel